MSATQRMTYQKTKSPKPPIPAASGPRRLGRPPGVPNAINRDVREMMFEALNRVGGAKYLAQRAIDTPASFMALLGKIMPSVVVGAEGSNISLHLIAAAAVSQQILEARLEPGPQQLESTAIDLAKQPTE